MELYVGTQKECKSPLSVSSGLVIYVHNHTYTLTEEDNGLQVQPGTQTDIAVDRMFVKKQPSPYSDCYEQNTVVSGSENKLISRTVNLTGIYTQQYCLQLCYQDFLIEFCDCYDHILPHFNPENKQPCPKFIDSLYNCQYLIKRLFYNGKNDGHCLKECPKECDYIKYDTTISNSEYPSASYLEYLNAYLPANFTKKGQDDEKTIERSSLLAVNVFYPSSSYTKITEEPSVSIVTDVLPNVGGDLGLFLGNLGWLLIYLSLG